MNITDLFFVCFDVCLFALFHICSLAQIQELNCRLGIHQCIAQHHYQLLSKLLIVKNYWQIS